MRCSLACFALILPIGVSTPVASDQESSAQESASGVYVRLVTIEVDCGRGR